MTSSGKILCYQLIFALTTVALDGVACYFAAETLGVSQGLAD